LPIVADWPIHELVAPFQTALAVCSRLCMTVTVSVSGVFHRWCIVLIATTTCRVIVQLSLCVASHFIYASASCTSRIPFIVYLRVYVDTACRLTGLSVCWCKP